MKQFPSEAGDARWTWMALAGRFLCETYVTKNATIFLSYIKLHYWSSFTRSDHRSRATFKKKNCINHIFCQTTLMVLWYRDYQAAHISWHGTAHRCPRLGEPGLCATRVLSSSIPSYINHVPFHMNTYHAHSFIRESWPNVSFNQTAFAAEVAFESLSILYCSSDNFVIESSIKMDSYCLLSFQWFSLSVYGYLSVL